MLSIVFIIFAGMKAKLFAIGFFLFTLAACTQRAKAPEPVEGPTYELQSIDSLMWRHPDSALTRLLPWFDTCCRDAARHFSTASAYNRHYANLLLSELLYKNDYPQTNRRELLQAVAYFDSISQVPEPVEGPSNRIAFLDARAHYINGVGYYENDSAVKACKEYMKALEVMEGHFEEKELLGNKARIMALTYTHLTGLFSDLYLHEQAIYFAQCSLPYYMKRESPSWNESWVLNEIGIHFDMMEELDSAEYYYNKAMTALNDTNSLMYRDVAMHQTYLEYKKDSLQVNASLLRLFHLLSKSENKVEIIARSLTIGEIFYHEIQFDSAWSYLDLVYRETPNVAAKKQAAEWLVEICKAQNRISEMHEYAEFLVPFANQEENNSGTKSQLTQLYNTFVQAKSDRKHQIDTKKHIKQVITAIVSLLLIMLIIIILNFRNKRHKRKLEALIESERHAHKMQQAALAGRLRQSNAALKGQNKKVSSIVPLSFANQSNKAENYSEEPICQQILAVCNDKNNPIKSTVPVSAYSSIALTDVQKAQLKEVAMRHYDSLFKNLKLQYPELKDKDFLYCYLCLLGLDNMQIGVLTQLSYRTIWEREKRLQNLFHADDKIAIILHEMMMH